VTDDGNGMTYSFDPLLSGVGVHTIRYDYTDTNGCMNSATDDIEVFALLMYTAPSDLCIDAGLQVGLGGGTPTGGFYSGDGVMDDGNGMTYSFDPLIAGAGIHTITYQNTSINSCMNIASDDIEVFALPIVMYTAPSDLCIDAGVQTGLGGGTPTGGVYSGDGVMDDGNGMTYSFDPLVAGAGIHTITYDYTDTNGCMNIATDNIEVFALPVGVQTGLGGGTPTGGEYSGDGVIDDGNGMTYSFDPLVAGVGTHTITYDYTDSNGCMNSASDDVEVFAVPDIEPIGTQSTSCPFIGIDLDILTITDNNNLIGTVTTFHSAAPSSASDLSNQLPSNLILSDQTIYVMVANTFTGCFDIESFMVEVYMDVIPPVLYGIPSDVIVECDAVPTIGTITASDDCDENVDIDYTFIQLPGTCSNSYTLLRTWTATDNSGNSSIQTQTIIVEDNLPPMLTCETVQVTLDENDTGVISVDDIVCDEIDCGQIDLVILPGQPVIINCSRVGHSILFVRATDACGNFEDYQLEVEIIDPDFSCCSGNINLFIDESGMKDYETKESIISTQIILPGAQIDYDAAESIELLPGFEVQLGAELDAFIDGCNGGAGGNQFNEEDNKN